MLFRKNADLFVVIALANIAVIAFLTNLTRWLGLPLMLILPGYALMVALLPGIRLRSGQLFLCSVALSLALAVLSGLVINFCGQRLAGQTWLIALYFLTCCLSLVCFLRRQVRSEMPFSHLLSIPWIGPLQAGLLGLAVILTVVAVRISSASTAEPTASFAQLWMLPLGQPPLRSVEVGLQNVGTEPGSYDLVIVHGQDILAKWSALNLEANTEWTTQISLPPQVVGGVLEVLVYRAGNADVVYRYVKLSLDSGQ